MTTQLKSWQRLLLIELARVWRHAESLIDAGDNGTVMVLANESSGTKIASAAEQLAAFVVGTVLDLFAVAAVDLTAADLWLV